MKPTMRGFLGICATSMLAFSIAAGAASAPQATISGAWVRWLPGDLPAAGYATIHNEGTTPLRLTGARSPDYGHVMLHRSVSENGVERMVMSMGVDIAPGASLALAPGGYHLMLMKPAHAIKPGDTVTIRFLFDGDQSIDVNAKVMPASATGPG